ncbi:MAG: AEC family transporter [Promethearchaeota archaeon]
MNGLFFALLIFYLVIALGYIFGRIFKSKSKEIGKYLSFILLFILAPPLVLFAFLIPNESLEISVIINIVIFQIILVFTSQFVAYLIILRKKGTEDNQRKGSILSIVSFPNAFLFPLPIVLSLFGPGYIVILVIFSLSAQILRSTLLTYQCIYYGKKTKTYLDSLKELITFPPTVALIISVILNLLGIRLTQEIYITFNEILSTITSIFGALIIGLLLVNFDFSRFRQFIINKDFIMVLIVRVGYSFVLFLILVQLLKFSSEMSPIILIILMILFVDPPAVSNVAYAEYFELDYEFSGFCVFTITMMAIIYIPIFIFLGIWLF